MLVRSVMWCACLMACVTSSFMLCISYQWKGPCVCAHFRGGEAKTQKLWTAHLQHTYHLKQRSTHISSAKKRLTRLSLKKNPFHYTLPCFLSIFHLLFFYHIYPEFSSSQMDSSPAHTLPVFTVLCISVFVNISDTAPDTSHTSPSIPHFLFFFSTQSTSSFVPGTNLHKNEQINEMSQRHFSLKINTKKMW